MEARISPEDSWKELAVLLPGGAQTQSLHPPLPPPCARPLLSRQSFLFSPADELLACKISLTGIHDPVRQDPGDPFMKTEAGCLETAKPESSLLYDGSKVAVARFV